MSVDPAAAGDSPAGASSPLERTYGREEAAILIDQAALSLTSFVTELLLVRTLQSDPTEYASYVLAGNLLIAFLILQNSILAIPLAIFLPGAYRDRPGAYAQQLLRIQNILCALLGIVSLATAAVFAIRGEPVFARTLAVLAMTQAFLLGRELVRRFHFAARRTGRTLRADLLSAAFQIAAVSALYLAGAATGAGTLGVMALACALGFLVTRLPKADAHEPAVELSEVWARHRRLGIWILATNMVLVGGLFAYPWLLKMFRPAGTAAAEVAHFGAVRMLIAVAHPLILAVNAWTASRASHARALGGPAAIHREILRSTLFLGAALSAVAFAIACFAEPLLRFLTGTPALALELAPAARLAAFVVLLQSVAMPAQIGLNTLERPAGALPGALGALLVTATLGVLWTLHDGVMGAVRGLLAAQAALVVGYWIAYLAALRRARREAA